MISGVLNRKAKSYASSPHLITDYFRSHHSSPILKESPKIHKLVKNSLKKFKDEKVELEKIKEHALSWKQSRKKKLQKYNIKTRLENKAKVKSARFDFESKTNDGIDGVETADWPSSWNNGPAFISYNPVFALNKVSENFNTNEGKIKKKSKSADRRANIGLEFFHLKTPKVLSPKNERVRKKSREKNEIKIKNEYKAKENKKLSKDTSKKDIIGFMERKRKERIVKNKQEKISQHENEVKRLKQLMKLEKEAKKVLKKKKLPKSLRSKFIPESFERLKDKSKSICYSEDEEVIKIIHEKKSGSNTSAKNQDYIRIPVACIPSKPAKISSKSNPKMKLRPKHSNPSEPNSSNPIIELRSISRSSSSDLSEQKESLKKRIQDIKFRLKFFKDPMKIPTADVRKAQNLIGKMIYRSVSENFFLIKHYENDKKRKSLIESSLLSSNFSRHSSEDMEKIWDRLEFYKPIEFLQDRDSLPPLTPIEEYGRLSKPNSKKPSEEIPMFLIESLKNINSCKGSIDIDEVSQEYLDSSSKLSQDENIILENVEFKCKNLPLDYPIYQLEPEPYREKRKSDILIDDNSVSVAFEGFGSFKDVDCIESLEEEIEEFDSVKVTAEAEESAIQEKVFTELSAIILYDLTYIEIEKDFNLKSSKKPEKQGQGFIEPNVRTGVTSVCRLVEKIWLHLDPLTLMESIQDHLTSTPLQNSNLNLSLIPNSTLNFVSSDSPEPHTSPNLIHSQMVLDCVNSCLSNLVQETQPKFWQRGLMTSKSVDLDMIFRLVLKDIRKCSIINAGRIANISMINSDGVIDESLLQRIRENGLSAMLTGEIEDIEKEWVDYEADEISVSFEISDMVLSDLFTELVEILIYCNLSNLSNFNIFRS